MSRTIVGSALVVVGLALIGCMDMMSTGPSLSSQANRVEIRVTARGFEPSRVEVTHGQPVTLVVTRTSAMTCATEMTMPSHGIRLDLPLNVPQTVTFPCDSAAVMIYSCGMGMMRGEIVAR